MYCKCTSIVRELFSRFINFLLKGTIVMSTFEEVTALADFLLTAQEESNSAFDALDVKLDEIQAVIVGATTGGVLTQEQLDALGTKLSQAKEIALAGKTKAAAVLAEADNMDGTPVVPPVEPPAQ